MKKIVKYIVCASLFLMVFSLSAFAQDNTSVSASSYSGTIKVGEKFTYKIEVKMVNPLTVLTFRLLNGPSGMLVSEKEGIVTWTPTAKGEFKGEISITAGTLKVGSSVISLKVVDFLGSISGTITNDEGKPIEYALIILNKKVSVSGKPDSFIPVLKVQAEKITGKYSFNNLEAATYYIQALSDAKVQTSTGLFQTYSPNWYINSPIPENAVGVTIDQTKPSFTAADIKLHLNTEIPVAVYNYSFHIEKSKPFEFQIPIPLPANPLITEFRILKVLTSLSVTNLGKVSWNPSASGEFSTEIGVFNNNKKFATVIMKFTVADFLGSISGTISNDAGKPIESVYVILNKKVSASGFTPVFKAITDKTGKYYFTNLEAATYYIHAEPTIKVPTSDGVTQSYLSNWYLNSPTFDGAKGIEITQAQPTFTADMKLHLNTEIPVTVYNYSFIIEKSKPFTFQIPITLPTINLPNEFKVVKALSTLSVTALGNVTWTPSESGEFSAEIAAFNKNNVKVATVILKFRVIGFLGSISGTVKNDETAPLPLKGILVTLYKKISVDQKNSYSSSYSGMTDDKGNYFIEKVEAGSYFIYARTSYEKVIPPLPSTSVVYSPVWYKDSPSMDKAEAVEITELKKALIADLTMHKYIKVEPKLYTISGKVSSASGPIANAVVVASLNGNLEPNMDNSSLGMGLSSFCDPAFGLFSDIIGKAVTDKEGNYKMQVREGVSCIIACYSAEYQNQYYDGKDNVLNAAKLMFNKDYSGINFLLLPLPQAKGSIAGIMVDDSKTGIVGKAVLYNISSVSSIKMVCRTVNTNEKGEFLFEKVANAKYYLQVVPLKGYMPAYYKLNQCGIKEPALAEVISIENDAAVKGLSVCVKKITTTGGGKISGFIKDIRMNGISGVIVTAESNDLDDNSYAVTNSDGSYEISGLGVGDYTITCEKLGYSTITKDGASIDYAKNAFNSSVDLVMVNNSVTAVESDDIIPAEFSLYQNYPNPFNPATKIRFALPHSTFTKLSVFDALGREVKILVNSVMNAGQHEIEFNAANLSSGVYFYRIEAEGFSAMKKLVFMK